MVQNVVADDSGCLLAFPPRASRILKGLGELVTASEWKRAAIVWAFTEDQQGKRTSSTSERGVSLTEFAGFQVAGLSSRTTLIKYRKAWKLAIEHGFATDVKPGDPIDLRYCWFGCGSAIALTVLAYSRCNICYTWEVSGYSRFTNPKNLGDGTIRHPRPG